jgi:hypothetical protein
MKNETTIERIEQAAAHYYQNVNIADIYLTRRDFIAGAKSEHNTILDEVIELIKSDESKFKRSMDEYNAWCNFIVDLEQLKLKL